MYDKVQEVSQAVKKLDLRIRELNKRPEPEVDPKEVDIFTQ